MVLLMRFGSGLLKLLRMRTCIICMDREVQGNLLSRRNGGRQG